MKCITRHTQYDSRSDVFRLLAIADVHLGNLHANEKLLRQLAQEIQSQPLTYWIGLGDMCEFINLRDPRFDPSELAPWLGMDDLKDLARAEVARFLDIMRPCAAKCIGFVEGNHEYSILQHSESDVYSAMIEGLADKEYEHRLDHRGMVSWVFDRGDAKANGWALRIHATHGSGGGAIGGRGEQQAHANRRSNGRGRRGAHGPPSQAGLETHLAGARGQARKRDGNDPRDCVSGVVQRHALCGSQGLSALSDGLCRAIDCAERAPG